MGRIDYRAIYEENRHDWFAMTEEPQRYEALLAGHYSDSNHFIYELLQNAEDENASHVVIEYYEDRLVFYHDGDPFDEADVRGVSSMLMGTKSSKDAQTIGRFGMGFKSVYRYTCQPEVYSDEEAFRILNYLLPEEIGGWDHRKARAELTFPDGEKEPYAPFYEAAHLTKILIPFLKKDRTGRLTPVPSGDVYEKLQSLTGDILLFLESIQELYWINRNNGDYAHIRLTRPGSDRHVFVCSVSSARKKREVLLFLKYGTRFDLEEMRGAEVSIAYRLGNTGKTIAPIKDPPIWVYFPTREDTEIPFLIHGSFETAVSREKLMSSSGFNDRLFERIGTLVAESLEDLARRELLTQGFIREILFPAFQEKKENKMLPGLKEKVTEQFLDRALIPCKDGYRLPEDVQIPLPFRIAEMEDNILLKDLFGHGRSFVILNNERDRNYAEYIHWLEKDLHVRSFDLSDLAEKMKKIPVGLSLDAERERAALQKIYEFLSYYMESAQIRGAGDQEALRQESIQRAWDIFRTIPIILNEEGRLVRAYCGGTPNSYLHVSSSYRNVAPSAIVDAGIAESHSSLLRDGFRIPPFDDLQYVKEKVITVWIRMAWRNISRTSIGS